MFKELAPLLRQRSVLLSLTRLEDDTIRVNVFPKKLADGENEALTTPLSVTGTAEEPIWSFAGSGSLKDALDRATTSGPAAVWGSFPSAMSRRRSRTQPSPM
jgi:PRTRC genetic system protein E